MPQNLSSTANLVHHVRDVLSLQGFNNCKVQLHLYYTYGPTESTVPYCILSTAKPLYQLRALRPLLGLSTCRVQVYFYSR